MTVLARQIIPFTSEAAWLAARMQDITSTDVACLFGVGRMSPYKLWHVKRGNIADDFKENERTIWGQRLQDSIAAGVAIDNGWNLRRMDEYIRIPELRIGSSFDYCDAQVIGTGYSDPTFLVEVKNVDSYQFKLGWWLDDQGMLRAPHRIELQVQHELLVSGLTRCYIPAFVGGNSVALLEREADAFVHRRIIEESDRFWNGPEPSPDFAADYEVIAKLYGYSEPGKVIAATPHMQDLIRQHLHHTSEAKRHDETRKAIAAELILLRGEAEVIENEDGSKAVAAMRAPVSVAAHTRNGYLHFQTYPPKK